MDSTQIGDKLDEMFDCAMVRHGFLTYMRDYEVVIRWADDETGNSWHDVQYLFRYCVKATVSTGLSPDTWSRSLDDILVDPGDFEDSSGFLWGVRWSLLYPGARLTPNSEVAARWSSDVGIPFYEAVIDSGVFTISLIFSDLSVIDPAPAPLPDRD